MRFMLLLIPAGFESAAPGANPETAAGDSMSRYNQQLERAGVLLALDGLLPPSTGARVTFPSGRPTARHGPFSEVKETLGGYWILEVTSREEAIEWAKRCPGNDRTTIEVRQVREFDDVPHA